MIDTINPQVIGISGVTGAGKSTLTHALGKTLNATMLFWDDFDEISISPDDYVDWYRRGRNYDEWNYQTLADALKSLKKKQTIIHPVFNVELPPTSYIIFDAPLGRLHSQTAIYIDVWIHIEVPLDVSLCRRTIRDFKQTTKTRDDLLAELEYYLSSSRPLFFDDHLRAGADLVIDGMLDTEKQIQKINEYLNTEKRRSYQL